MSIGRHSYVRFFPSDWLAGTARMTRMHKSAYFDICLYIWDKAEPCPAGELPLMLGDIPNWRELVQDLIDAGKLVRLDDGSVTNAKAWDEAQRAFELWHRQSAGGRSGALKTNSQRSGSPDGSPDQLEQEPDVPPGESGDDRPDGCPDGIPARSPDGVGPGDPTQNQNQNQNQKNTPAIAGVGPTGPPQCPQREIIEIYHETLPELQRVRVITGKREQHLRARWREDPGRQSLDWWRRYFAYVRRSSFLMGRAPPSPGRSKPFLADLEWLVCPGNMAKVIEGKYHDEPHRETA